MVLGHGSCGGVMCVYVRYVGHGGRHEVFECLADLRGWTSSDSECTAPAKVRLLLSPMHRHDQ